MDTVLVEDQLISEIDNIKSILEATKENIDALNARFEKFSPPPKMYLENLRVRKLKNCLPLFDINLN